MRRPGSGGVSEVLVKDGSSGHGNGLAEMVDCQQIDEPIAPYSVLSVKCKLAVRSIKYRQSAVTPQKELAQFKEKYAQSA